MKITFRKYVEKQNVSIGKVVKVHKIAHAVFILFSCHLHSIKFNAASPCGPALGKPYWLMVSAVLASPVLAGGVSNETLIKRFYAANLACNGIHNGCPARDHIIAQLEARGYCFVGTSMADLHCEYAGSRALCAQMRGTE